jgi:hypothetical protein
LTADCPLDHLKIGCNPDGIIGTEDDLQLYVNQTQKYRHSDPDNSGDPTWMNPYYPMYYNSRYSRYYRGEPGFDLLTNDPNHVFNGTQNTDFQIFIECVDITPDLSVRETTEGILLDEPGDSFNYSAIAAVDPHLHLDYRVYEPAADPNQTYWITYRLVDNLEDGDQYLPSDEFSIVFMNPPMQGDIILDNSINLADILFMCRFWMHTGANYSNDFYERCDLSRDGRITLEDLALLAREWQNHSDQP